MVGDERRGRAGAVGRQRVRHGLAAEPRVGQPARGARVQLGLEPRALQPQPGAQQLGEQAVVAEPGALTVERHDEQAAVLELLEQERAVAAAGQRVREAAADPLGDARDEQQLARRAGQARQDLAREVVGHRAVVAREPRDERVRIGLAPHRQPREP